MPTSEIPHVIVAGAGLAGLIAAADLARAGVRVTVLDGAGHLGGRAHTTRTSSTTPDGIAPGQEGFHRNLGPHAVYRRAELAATLRRLGVPVRGKVPNVMAAQVRIDGRTRSGASFVPVLPALTRLLRRPPESGATVAAWLDAAHLDDRARSSAQMLVRTTTYVQAPDVQDATSAFQQMRRALPGVLYVHHGWSTLVDGLAEVVRAAGGQIRSGCAVRRVHLDDDTVAEVELADGTNLPADGVVLAVGGPRDAARLLADADDAGHGVVGGRGDVEVAARLHGRADVPARMATLDLLLDRAPTRSARGPAQVLGGGDDPRYWLVQSRFARLAPEGGEVVHVARYLAPDERGDAHTRADLETLADEVQPGWRARLRHARFLPNMTVTHAIPLAATGGLDGRVPVRVGVPGLAIAGDAVGTVGQLADAAAASGAEAAAAVLADLTSGRRGRTPAEAARTGGSP